MPSGQSHSETDLVLPDLRKGARVLEMLKALVRANSRIECLGFVGYSQPPMLQERLELDHDEAELYSRALEFRERFGLPFWSALLLNASRLPHKVGRIVANVGLHQPNSQTLELDRDELEQISESSLRGLFPGKTAAVNSRVSTRGGSRRHLLMMDLQCPTTDAHDELVSKLCRTLADCRWAVFASGKSYHCYGLELVDEERWRHHLSSALLFAPLVDQQWIAHQLIDGSATLRVLDSAAKPTVPTLRCLL